MSRTPPTTDGIDTDTTPVSHTRQMNRDAWIVTGINLLVAAVLAWMYFAV